MRIYLKTSKSIDPIPFDHLHKLVGVIHKWLGPENKYHGNESLFSFSWLKNSVVSDGMLQFPQGAFFFISAHDRELIKSIIYGIQSDPFLFSGLRVTEVQIIKDHIFQSGTERFTLASPILLKKRDNDRVDHILYDNENADIVMTESLLNKMRLAKIDSSGFSAEFDKLYKNKKTKLVNYNGIKNRASLCPILISGSTEQKLFVWNVGVGNSTGIGFGALN